MLTGMNKYDILFLDQGIEHKNMEPLIQHND